MRLNSFHLVNKLMATAIGLCTLISVAPRVQAHEYWLEPAGTQWQAGETLQADIKNGQDFAGTSYPFDPDGLSRAGLISPAKRIALYGRLGDYPAFQMPLQESGLHLLLLETTKRELVYKDRETFDEFVEYHALNDAIYKSDQFSIPDADVTENYYRYCKALVNVSAATAESDSETSVGNDNDTLPGNAALEGQDQRLELVIAENPLGAQSMRVQVLFEGEPLAQRQIELFYKDESKTVTRFTQSSDDSGYAEFDVAASGDYLLNAVWVQAPEDESADLVSLWASLFFHQ